MAWDTHTQRVLAFCLLLPWLVLASVIPFSPERFANALQGKHVALKVDSELAVVLALLSTPHVFYFFVWTNAKKWMALCKALGLGEPFKVFALCAHLIKALQFVVLAHFFRARVPTSVEDMSQTLLGLLSALDPFQILLGAELITLGQVFNGGVYSAIGEAGVYYGTRLGKKVPWVEGFPFSVVPHPQYLGATLSFWGALLLLINQDNAQRGTAVIALTMAVYYAFSSYVEQEL